MITQAAQDYLKIIYILGNDQVAVNTSAIAAKLEVAQASVTGMLKKLSELKLITHKKYYGVELTDSGRKIALEVLRHHRLLELYLAEALGYSWDQVHDEAEKLEHHISEEFEEKMAQFLGNPMFDPHGDPIPSKDGVLPERNLMPLSNARLAQTVQVKQVSDSNPEMLRYLGEIGIYPETELDVIGKAPFGGTLHVRVNQKEYHLGEPLTNQIFIAAPSC